MQLCIDTNLHLEKLKYLKYENEILMKNFVFTKAILGIFFGGMGKGAVIKYH